jgi:hypothetical protein
MQRGKSPTSYLFSPERSRSEYSLTQVAQAYTRNHKKEKASLSCSDNKSIKAYSNNGLIFIAAN